MVSLRHSLPHHLSVCLVLSTLLFFAPAASAHIGFQPVSPEELKMTNEPAAPGAPAIILFREVDRDDNSGSRHEDQYIRIKILAEAGRKYADVEIPFEKDIEGVSNVGARSIAPDGTISEFQGKFFEKTVVKAKGIKYLAKVFALPNVQVGSVIEYYYTYDLRDKYVFNSHWVLSEELFTRDAKFSLKSWKPRYNTVTVRWSWRGLPPGSNPPVEGPDHVIRFEAHNIPAFQEEDYMPPPNELKSRVDFVYSFEAPERDQNRFWAQVGKTRYEHLEAFLGKPGTFRDAVGQIISPSDGADERLRKLYARVQQLRNTSYEVQKTQQEEKREGSKAIKTAQDVWKRGYGDGVELTFLYLALVRDAGYPAYGVWVSDRRNYFFDPGQMDSFRLDANLVLVEVNGMQVFCDPGAKFAPFGLLPWAETGVQGLRLEKDGGSWIRTPLPDSSVSRIVRDADLQLTLEGDLEGKLTVTYSGLEAMSKRSEQRNEDDTERKKYMEDHVKEYISAGSEVELTNHPDWTSSSPEFTAEFKIKIPGWASNAGKRILLPVGLFCAGEKGVFEHANRIHPVYFDYPFTKVDNVQIEFPGDWKVSNLPSPQSREAGAAAYSLKVSQERNRLRVTRTLRSDIFMVAADQYPALRGFFQFVRTGDDAQVLLEEQSATARN